jgi:hypothetical protein
MGDVSPLEVLLGPADAPVYRPQRLDAAQIVSERVRGHARGHRLAGAALT